MLEIFKRNTFFSVLLLLPYATILHLGPWFIELPPSTSSKTWLFTEFVWPLFSSVHYQKIFATLLIAFTSFIIAQLVSKFKLMPDAQLFPSLFYILFCGIHFRTLELSAILIGNVFFSLSLLQLFQIYQKKQAPVILFNFGFLIGLASLFYLPYFYLLFVGVIGLFILRGFKPRELFQIIGGFLNVFILLFLILFLFNIHGEFYDHQIASFFRPFIFSMKFQREGWVLFGIVLVSIFYGLANYSVFQIKKSISVQKIFDILFWCLLVGLFSTFFLSIDNPGHLILIFTPLAILCGYLFSRIKNPLIAETLHLFLIMISLFLQFQNW